MKNGKTQKRFPPASASEVYNGPFQLDFGRCFFLVSRKKSGINSWGIAFSGRIDHGLP